MYYIRITVVFYIDTVIGQLEDLWEIIIWTLVSFPSK